MPIAFGSTLLSPITGLVEQYSTKRLPKTATNGEIIYCPDGNGFSGGAMAHRIGGSWKKFDNTNLVPSAASLFDQTSAMCDYNPTANPFNVQILSNTVSAGIRTIQLYIDMVIFGYTFPIYCLYAYPDGQTNLPCIFFSDGWLSSANPHTDYNGYGYAIFSYDYGGDPAGQAGYPPYWTQYPNALRYGNHRTSAGGYRIKNTNDLTGQQVTDPKQTDEYLWNCIMRRAFEYMMTRPEIDTTKIGAHGYSWGGTMVWNFATETRLKAIVSFFGCGNLVYWRDNGVWKYNNPYVQPAMGTGQISFLNSPSAEAYAKDCLVPFLWINGTAEYHGQQDRGEDNFLRMPNSVPWDFSHDANKAHDISLNTGNAKLWLDKYVKGDAITWPKKPNAWLSINAGTPQFNVRPDLSVGISSVQFWKAEKEPNPTNRVWTSVTTSNNGVTWTGSMPVTNSNDYLFAFANIIYTNGVVTSTFLNAAIPSKLT